MKRIVVSWRDNTKQEFFVKKFFKDRNGDFVWESPDDFTSHVPASAVFMINVAEVEEK